MQIFSNILLLFFLMNSGFTIAQQVDSLNQELPQSLYLDLATFLIVGNLSINYELPLQSQWLLRFGIGLGYDSGYYEKESRTTAGLLSMINFITEGSSSHFESGAGISINSINDGEGSQWKIYPAFIIGYRYQAYDGGFIFRTGLGATLAFGYLLYLSFGTTI